MMKQFKKGDLIVINIKTFPPSKPRGPYKVTKVYQCRFPDEGWVNKKEQLVEYELCKHCKNTGRALSRHLSLAPL